MEIEKCSPKHFNISSVHIIKNERIHYNNSITINSLNLTEVYHYSREFKTFNEFKMLTVILDIPFTGNNVAISRSRILLYLDDELLCDGTIFNQNQWELKPLHLEGIAVDIKPGNHKVKLMCCVDKGILNIPHFNEINIEKTIKPELSGKFVIIGQN